MATKTKIFENAKRRRAECREHYMRLMVSAAANVDCSDDTFDAIARAYRAYRAWTRTYYNLVDFLAADGECPDPSSK